MAKSITVTDFIARHGTAVAAARALGCNRVTLWRWQRRGERFPGPWADRAEVVVRKAPKRLVPRS